MTQISTVGNLKDELSFTELSQDVESIKEDLGEEAEQFDSFWVYTEGGEYTEVWGMYGIIPDLQKLTYRLR